jgi:tRNA dimethylallyltransferase
MKKNKILVICGLTATGKTSLALKVARKLGNTSLISVDSRQAYQGLPVLSGQDIPLGFIRHQDSSCKYQALPGVFFSSGSINIWGIDQVPPSGILNISDFTNFIWKVIKKETKKNRSIIIVGGTGLYLKALTEPLLDIHTGFNQKLRTKLTKLSLEDLQDTLKTLDIDKFNSLNHSDQLNPRRLIRAIEILKNPSSKKPSYLKDQEKTLFHWVGLKGNQPELAKKIRTRVLTRLKNKAVDEVNALRDLQADPKSPIFSALGLAPILEYSQKNLTKKELIESWTKADLKFAKRQLTWFKKQNQIIWYDQDSHQEKLIKDQVSWLNK